jgi:hypothetical protein
MAWRTFGSSKGGLSTRMVKGTHCPGSETSALMGPLEPTSLIKAMGAMAKTSMTPPCSAANAASSVGKSMMVSVSR